MSKIVATVGRHALMGLLGYEVGQTNSEIKVITITEKPAEATNDSEDKIPLYTIIALLAILIILLAARFIFKLPVKRATRAL